MQSKFREKAHRELLRESSNADRQVLQIGNLKRQYAVESAIFNRFRSALVDLRNCLPPIRCDCWTYQMAVHASLMD